MANTSSQLRASTSDFQRKLESIARAKGLDLSVPQQYERALRLTQGVKAPLTSNPFNALKALKRG